MPIPGLSPRASGPATGLAVLALAALSSPAQSAEWTLVSLQGAAPVAEASVAFDAEGGMAGTTGCNRFTTTVTYEDGALVLPEAVAMTRMACPGDLMRQEDTFTALLQGRVAVGFDPITGLMTLSRDDVAAVFAPRPEDTGLLPTHAGRDRPAGDPPYLSAFGVSDIGIFADRDTASAELAREYSGTVLRNLGCEGDWCQVEAVSGAYTGWADASVLEAAGSALRAGQDIFDATGFVPCAKGTGAPMGQCPFGVARDGGGTATLTVIKAGGVPRVLYFADGAFTSSDTSQAGGGFDSSATKEADLFLIRVDDERYEVPEAAIFGG